MGRELVHGAVLVRSIGAASGGRAVEGSILGLHQATQWDRAVGAVALRAKGVESCQNPRLGNLENGGVRLF